MNWPAHNTMRTAIARGLTGLCTIVLTTACRPSISHQKVQEALKRLQKVDAATKVGVSYVHYRQLLVDAQEAIDDMARADQAAPGRHELTDAMKTYTEAGEIWDRDIHHR